MQVAIIKEHWTMSNAVKFVTIEYKIQNFLKHLCETLSNLSLGWQFVQINSVQNQFYMYLTYNKNFLWKTWEMKNFWGKFDLTSSNIGW